MKAQPNNWFTVDLVTDARLSFVLSLLFDHDRPKKEARRREKRNRIDSRISEERENKNDGAFVKAEAKNRKSRGTGERERGFRSTFHSPRREIHWTSRIGIEGSR